MTTKRGCNVIVLVLPPSECEKNAIVVRNEVLLWSATDPVTLTLTFDTKTVSLLGYPKVIPYTKFEHFGNIRFWVMLRTNRQTNKRTRTSYRCRPTKSVTTHYYVKTAAIQRGRNRRYRCMYHNISYPREDERLSWPCWLTYSGRFTRINGYPSAAGPVQASESSPVRDWRSTTEPPNQLCYTERTQRNEFIPGISSPRSVWHSTDRVKLSPGATHTLAVSSNPVITSFKAMYAGRPLIHSPW